MPKYYVGLRGGLVENRLVIVEAENSDKALDIVRKDIYEMINGAGPGTIVNTIQNQSIRILQLSGPPKLLRMYLPTPPLWNI